MNKTDQTNQAVIKLWKRHIKADDNELIPLIYPPLNAKADLLFVSLNPALPKKKDWEFFLWKNFLQSEDQVSYLRRAQKKQEHARERIAFYGPFREMAKDFRVKWEHVDLFFYRMTKAKGLKKIVCVKDNFKELNPFGERQLQLSSQLIAHFSPKIVVVANVEAARIFAREFAAEFDKERCCHWSQINGKTVPTFLGSPLSGLGTMDRYSRQRLEWHIARTLEGD